MTFLTSPPGARIALTLVAYPQQPQVIGISGKPVIWDLSRFEKGRRYELHFTLEHYRTRTVTLDSVVFYAMEYHVFPADAHPIQLEPVTPVIIPVYCWARNHQAASLAIFVGSLTALSILIFGVMLPRHRRLNRRIENAAAWEASAAEADKDDPMHGYLVGAYRLVEKIGHGGMATVYRALHRQRLNEGKGVAVKLMNEEASGDEEFRARFRREVSITGKMDHPSILRVYDYGDQDGMLYMVMELVRGGTLRDRMTAEGLDLETFMVFFRPLCEALHYAHGRGVVHRDVKPENIMITEKGQVRVMDFGVARAVDMAGMTGSGETIGTPAYMAPEQETGGDVDGRTDQYSLGVLAYEMLTGQLPFVDEKPVNILLRHIREIPRAPLEIRPDLPLEVANIVLRMLEKDREKRFPTLLDVAGELEKAIAEACSRKTGNHGRLE